MCVGVVCVVTQRKDKEVLRSIMYGSSWVAEMGYTKNKIILRLS